MPRDQREEAHDNGRDEASEASLIYPRSTSRFTVWVPLTLVILALAGLMIAPQALRQQTKNMRAQLRNVSEPTRLLLGHLRLGVAREQLLVQRVTIAPDSSTAAALRQAVAENDSVLEHLRDTLRVLGPGPRSAIDTLSRTLHRWREVAARDHARTADELLHRWMANGVTGDKLMIATLGVDTALAAAMQTRRTKVERYERLELELLIIFGAVGCLAAAAVLILTLRGRHLRHVLRRRAEDEASLRRLAGQLSGAFTVHDVAELTVDAALHSSRVGGAYLSAAADDHLEVLAARGSCMSSAGARQRLPQWLISGTSRDDPRIFTTEVRKRDVQLQTRSGYDARSLLVIPMRHQGHVIGTLVLASAGGRRTFGDAAVRYGRALGDLAAVAMHRAYALEQERSARSEAEAAVRSRDAVVSMVSHDLRNPLTAIIAGTDLVMELLKDDDERETERGQLSRVKHAATTMNRLISDLLDVARIESGPLALDRRPLNLVDIVNEVVDMFGEVVRRRGIEIERVVPPHAPAVSADHDRIAQALSNLIGNAVKFTPAGGHVTVMVEDAGESVGVHVRDTGPGIAAESLPHIFDRFWQATHRDGRGLGLGLSIVKGIVEAHGGNVDVKSEPNRGTSIGFVLPCADRDGRLPKAG